MKTNDCFFHKVRKAPREQNQRMNWVKHSFICLIWNYNFVQTFIHKSVKTEVQVHRQAETDLNPI